MRNTVLLLCFVFVGCAAPSVKQSKAENFSSASKGSYDQIKSDLTRSNNAYGFYFVEVYPITEALLRAQGQAAANKLDPNASKALEGQIDALVKNGTCFQFSVGTLAIESAKFKHWVANLDVGGTVTSIDFAVKSGVESVPSPHALQGYNWSNYAVGCAKQVSLSSGFKISVGNKIDPQAPVSELRWLP